jgi:capsular polysaccharide biosynthesis protein
MEHDAGRAGGTAMSWRAVRHHVALVLLLVVLGAVAGACAAWLRPVSYSSSAHVLVNPTEGNAYAPSGRNDELVSLETEAQLVRSDDVLDNAAAQTDADDSGTELESGLQVTVPTNTQIIEVTFTSSDPDAAQATAQAIADAYLEVRRERAEELVAERVESIDDQTQEVLDNLRRATEASQRGSDENRAFQGRLADALSGELVSLRTQRTALESTPLQPGSIYSPATEPTGESLTLTAALVAGGALLGLLLGLALALLREHRLGLVRSERDITRAGLPVVTSLPRLSTAARKRDTGPTQQALGEGTHRLRSFVLEHSRRPAAISVHGDGPPQFTRGIAHALAASLARAGYTVVVVDATGRASSRTAGSVATAGFADLLRSPDKTPGALVVPCAEPRLGVLPAGADPSDVADLMVPERLSTAVAQLKRGNEFVVIHGPALTTSHGKALADACDVEITVLTAGDSKLSDVRRIASETGGTPRVVGTTLIAAGGPRATLSDPCATKDRGDSPRSAATVAPPAAAGADPPEGAQPTVPRG